MLKSSNRVLKIGGFCVFDFIDINTKQGWEYLEAHSEQYGKCFTYHNQETIDIIFQNCNFQLVKRHQVEKSVYLVYQKTSDGLLYD